ncbi:MAG: hypothetical protein GXP27_18765 [Planctomycetes bacterium]|nr:hypothetical protein [Planctomycetota bacterium]
MHTYEPTGRYWQCLENAGLVRSTTGVRLINSPFGEDARRFNAVARIGGPLHRIIHQAKCHFVVDRVVGGSPYRDYRFDKNLIKAYADLLGEKFLGGQVHEVISNINNDWRRFREADPKYAREPIDADALRDRFDWSSVHRCLEYGTLDDYDGRRAPRDQAELWNEIERAAKRQGARFAGHFCYCEGTLYGELTWNQFYGFGSGWCLVEVGPWASRQTQFAIAALRGAARAAGKPWGIFFAPWGPNGCTSFFTPEKSSWQVAKGWMPRSSYNVGPNNGPSTALQRRIFFHAYLSGARTLHEEWGAEDNFVDWNSCKLSSYGRVTRDLLDFQDAFPDVGEPFVPIALVLDPKPLRNRTPWRQLKANLFQYSKQDSELASRKDAGRAEAECYPPSALPELFDIVPADASAEVWSNYRVVVPVDGSRPPAGIKTATAGSAWELLAEAARELSPFDRSTHLPMQINRRISDGAWIVGLYNPWGAHRGDVYGLGSILAAECTVRERLRPKFALESARAIHAWPDGSGLTVAADGTLEATVGPGGTLILEVLPRTAS